jgi:hypothetical protein
MPHPIRVVIPSGYLLKKDEVAAAQPTLLLLYSQHE